jgi:hypothetical protein
MNNRNYESLVAELKQQIDATAHLIEEVIHLDAMRTAYATTDIKMKRSKQDLQFYYTNSNISDIVFLQDTLTARECQKKIDTAANDMQIIAANITKLEQQKNIRLQPLNALLELVTHNHGNNDPKLIQTLLSQAKALNPEGTLFDKINMIAQIIKKIFTFHFDEISDVRATQAKRNTVNTSIHHLFHMHHQVVIAEEAEAGKQLRGK